MLVPSSLLKSQLTRFRQFIDTSGREMQEPHYLPFMAAVDPNRMVTRGPNGEELEVWKRYYLVICRPQTDVIVGDRIYEGIITNSDGESERSFIVNFIDYVKTPYNGRVDHLELYCGG